MFLTHLVYCNYEIYARITLFNIFYHSEGVSVEKKPVQGTSRILAIFTSNIAHHRKDETLHCSIIY